MNITEELKNVLEQNKDEFEKNPDFVKLQNFYKEMSNLGLIKKQEYTLPPVDTIGKKLFESYRANR